MYKAAAALKTFFSGFGVPAYAEDSVPDETELPYIAYSQNIPGWSRKASMFVKVWDRTTSNARIMQIADQITAAIGECKTITHEGGYLVLWPETPKVQIQVDGDVRYAYINLSANYYNMPGV